MSWRAMIEVKRLGGEVNEGELGALRRRLADEEESKASASLDLDRSRRQVSVKVWLGVDAQSADEAVQKALLKVRDHLSLSGLEDLTMIEAVAYTEAPAPLAYSEAWGPDRIREFFE